MSTRKAKGEREKCIEYARNFLSNESTPLQIETLANLLEAVRTSYRPEHEGARTPLRELATKLIDEVLSIHRGQGTLHGYEHDLWNGPDILLARDTAHKLRNLLESVLEGPGEAERLARTEKLLDALNRALDMKRNGAANEFWDEWEEQANSAVETYAALAGAQVPPAIEEKP